MIRLIEKEKTGIPETFANSLGICKSHLYRLIDELNDFGVTIAYSRKRQTFYFKGNFCLEINLTIELKKRNG
jgi:hypothetical protein